MRFPALFLAPALLADPFLGAFPSWAEDGGAARPVAESARRAPLPDPLSLDDALRLIDAGHPLARSATAGRALARSALERTAAAHEFTASLSLDGRYADKVAHQTDFIDDSRATLSIRKPLTDFGRGRAGIQAAEAHLAGVGLVNEWRAVQQRIEVMRRFFDVHLSDLRFFVDDEDMTLSFLRYDRVLERRQRYREFALLREKELEAEYRRRFRVRARSANRQRDARNRLALAMGRPGELVERVAEPDLAVYRRPPPDYDEALAEALAGHPLMRARDAQLAAAERRLEAAALAHRPRLSARFEARAFERRTSSERDELRAGVELLIPLGGRRSRDAETARRRAELESLKAERLMLEYELRQAVLDVVLEIDELEAARAAALADEEHRQLYLDRSRTLYELEERADLGDAQARQAEALWNLKRVEYEWALNWALLDAMRGMPLAVLPDEDGQ